MKKIYSIPLFTLLFSICAFSVLSCKTDNTTQENQADSQALATQFTAFVDKFQQESKTLPATFGEDWLDKQISPVKIDSLACVNFLHNNLIINHELMVGGSDAQEMELDSKKSYYYISKIPLGNNFISVIVSDLEKDATNTYLLNYTRDGKYISGIAMQCRYYLKDGDAVNKISRESVISDSQMILCQEKLVGRNKFISYDVLSDGKITKKN